MSATLLPVSSLREGDAHTITYAYYTAVERGTYTFIAGVTSGNGTLSMAGQRARELSASEGADRVGHPREAVGVLRWYMFTVTVSTEVLRRDGGQVRLAMTTSGDVPVGSTTYRAWIVN